MPTLGPETVHRIGTQRIVHNWGPGRRETVEAADRYERDETVDHVEAYHDSDAGHGVDERRHGVTPYGTEIGIEDGSSCRGTHAGE